MCPDLTSKLPAFVLTVPKQIDRYTDFLKCNKEYFKYMDVEPFTAIPISDPLVLHIHAKRGGSKEEISNRVSFAAMLKEAKLRGWGRVLLLEDDVQFEGHAEHAFKIAIEGLPSDFKVFTFGTYFRNATPNDFRKVSPGLLSMGSNRIRFWGAHAFMFSESVYDECIANYEDPHGQITDEFIYKTLVKKYWHKCFVCRPMMAFSRPVVGMHSSFPFDSMKRKTLQILDTAGNVV